MSDAPERIWVEPDYDHGWAYPRGEWSITCPWPHDDAVQYVRAARIAALEAEVARLREALTKERLENLWNAYNTGLEKNGEWSHAFMSDGEWLIGEIGLDPKKGWYDAATVKRLIPEAAARAALTAEGETP